MLKGDKDQGLEEANKEEDEAKEAAATNTAGQKVRRTDHRGRISASIATGRFLSWTA